MREGSNQAITLIALVITIIVLLLLVSVSIATLTGENGILTKANESKVQYEKAEVKEEIERAILEIEIQLKEENLQLELEDEVIRKELPNKLQNLTINDDMTGEYNGYKYWIDENNYVHIEEKEQNPISIQVNVDYVGTSSCTFNIEATSTTGKIVEYQYKMNNEPIQQFMQESFKIENLEPEKQYIISIIAIDENGNKNISKPITITTKERTYLYKEGEEYIELTGGWERGAYNIGSFSKDEGNYLHLRTNYPSGNGNQFWNTCQTRNSVDVTEYTKINYKYEIDSVLMLNGKYYSWIEMALCNPVYANYNTRNALVANYDSFQNNVDISKQIRTSVVNISNINEKVYPTVTMSKWGQTADYVGDIKVYEVWLEK